MVLTQFQELAERYYGVLKDFPEFKEAQDIYNELYLVRKQLADIERERLQDYNNLGKASKHDQCFKI